MTLFKHETLTPYTIKNYLVQSVLISAMALLFSDTWLAIYAALTTSAPPNWGMTDRWVHMILRGKFYTSSMSNEPALPYEWIKGLLWHYFIGWKFTQCYLLILHFVLKIKPNISNGLLFGLLLAVFPYLIQLPSMGAGVFGHDAATPWLIFFRVLSLHVFFGLGLGVGGLLVTRYVNKHASFLRK